MPAVLDLYYLVFPDLCSVSGSGSGIGSGEGTGCGSGYGIGSGCKDGFLSSFPKNNSPSINNTTFRKNCFPVGLLCYICFVMNSSC